VPLYPVYPLLFGRSGLSDTAISALFAIWSGAGLLAEVPAGALADRFSRRACLVGAGGAQAGGYLLWLVRPTFTGFALGFVLWGLGGALSSGALEALLHDGLTAAGRATDYPRLRARLTTVELLGYLPTALAATGLLRLGGYPLTTVVSIAGCLTAAAAAATLPEPPRPTTPGDDEPAEGGLRDGLRELARRPGLRRVVLVVAVLGGLDAAEEYFALLAHAWRVPATLVPLALLVVPLLGAAGAALGGRTARARTVALAGALGATTLLFGAAAALRAPVGMVGIAVGYGLYRLVWLVVDSRLQDRITGPARATVTSVAALGGEVLTFAVYGAWALGGPLTLVALFALATPTVLLLGRGRNGERGRPDQDAPAGEPK
jgi:hypothetical protein